MKKIYIGLLIIATMVVVVFIGVNLKPTKYYETSYDSHRNVWVIGSEIDKPDDPQIFISGIDLYKIKPDKYGVYHLTNTTIYYDEYRGYIARV